MISQFEDYSAVPTAVCEYMASRIALVDQYVLMQTGQYEYTALVYNPFSGTCTQYVFTRPTTYGSWTMTRSTEAEWLYDYTNEYYIYSNMGAGTMLDLKVHDAVSAHASVFLSVVLMFAIIYKGILFPALLGRRRKGW